MIFTLYFELLSVLNFEFESIFQYQINLIHDKCETQLNKLISASNRKCNINLKSTKRGTEQYLLLTAYTIIPSTLAKVNPITNHMS